MKNLLSVLSLALCSIWTAEAVTIRVKVPEGTKKCYVCGAFNNWNVSAAPALAYQGDNLFSSDLEDIGLSDLSGGYKYLCGQDWLYVEKDSNGNEINNRTVPGNPDVVENWRTMPEWSVESAELTVNGLPRQIKIYLPEGYEEGTESYPVIYYNSLQQRYSDAGSDSDSGDYFFGSGSWDAHTAMEQLRAEGSPAYIMVQINSMLAENTLAEHPDFEGTGHVEEYCEAFLGELMPFIENNWRVKPAPENCIITGADYGSLFALYAAVRHPEKFGTCVIMSPMLWINRSEILELAAEAPADTKFYVSAGSLEPEWMLGDVDALSDVIENSGAVCRQTTFTGASHNDESWGQCFPSVLKAIAADETPVSPVILKAAAAADSNVNFADAVYTLFAGPDQNNLKKIGSLTYTEEYRKKGSSSTVAAQVITYDIPVAYKSKYYWNIACGPDNSYPWLMSSPGNIGFSSKKSETSWHNIALFEDGSNQNNAAHSKGFRVVTSKESVLMSQAGDYVSKATVAFPGEDKSFTVHFGSVNSASDMGALTPSYYVGENCVEAEISYDFNLNKVSVKETRFGESLEKIKILNFSATPATVTASTDVTVSLQLSTDCDVELNATHDFNESLGLAFSKTAPGEYQLSLPDTKQGIYNLSINLVQGDNRLDNAAEINVRVLPAGNSVRKIISVNPYKDVDWNATGRYKANFHTHTSRSFDTQYTTTQVVDRYHDANYQILALTDHDANPYPWSQFDLYTPGAAARYAENMGMLAVPGCELSKDRRNNWSESTGGEFNHHNDLFTGRQGQEFMSLRESYAYTEALGGLQIINHPGQYWNLTSTYSEGAKNSPEWHAENFRLYSSLAGLEVYNQGNRRPNDRILWDQILTITMPERPVWGYSCDDTHTTEQYFRNYQYMLMPELTTDALKTAMKNGNTVFSYEYTGSGEALCPHIKSISVDEQTNIITIDTDDADNIKWISSFHNTGSAARAAGTPASTVVGVGKSFNFEGFQGSYVRALLTNKHGETATQPFGFSDGDVNVKTSEIAKEQAFSVSYTDKAISVSCAEGIERISVINTAGMVVRFIECGEAQEKTFSTAELDKGAYILVIAGKRAAYTYKFMAE